MICQRCRAAADATVEDDTPGPDEVLLGVFQRELHEQCQGCDCQHRIPEPEPTR